MGEGGGGVGGGQNSTHDSESWLGRMGEEWDKVNGRGGWRSGGGAK